MTADFHPLAASELTDAAVFYEDQAPGLGGDFLDEIERLVTLLSLYPDLGRQHLKTFAPCPPAASLTPSYTKSWATAPLFSRLPISGASRGTGPVGLDNGRHNKRLHPTDAVRC